MGKKLYVGGISWDTDEQTLFDAFSQAGTVESATIMMDRISGRSRGFGFVEMATDEEAQAAIELWNDKELDGRKLTVNEARPQADRPRQGGFNRGGGGGRNDYRGGGGRRSY